MTWDNNGTVIVDPEQVVLESDPYRRLAYTWHTFTPELNDASIRRRALRQARGRAALARRVRHRTGGDVVKLTVVHDDFEPGSTVATMVRNGWPVFLSSLKTLLETGEPLPSTHGAPKDR